MREIAAIAVRDGSENVFSIVGRFELDLGDAGEVFADRINVLGIGRPDFMKINLLIKIQVRIWSFAFAGESRVCRLCASDQVLTAGSSSCSSH